MLVGTALAWNHGSQASALAVWHHWLGWAVLAIGVLQMMSGIGRGSKGGPTEPSMRGDHYDMTARRRWFERFHKAAGWFVLSVAVAVIGLGLVAADAPRWMAGVLTIWWVALALMARRWQGQGRCIDTYEAIWGPDPMHPGNHLAPIGFRVRRMGQQSSYASPSSSS